MSCEQILQQSYWPAEKGVGTNLTVGVPGHTGRIGLLIEQLFSGYIIDHQYIVLIHNC